MVPRLFRLVIQMLFKTRNTSVNSTHVNGTQIHQVTVTSVKSAAQTDTIVANREQEHPVTVIYDTQGSREQVPNSTHIVQSPEETQRIPPKSGDDRWTKHLTERERIALLAKRESFLYALNMLETLDMSPEEHERAVGELKKRLLASLLRKTPQSQNRT